MSRGCFDGQYDRDDIYYVYPDGEGTRETDSPLTGYQSEGVSSGDTYTIYTLYDRASPSTTYDVTFGSGFNPTVAVSTSGNPAIGGITVNNGWVVYIQSGFLFASRSIEIKDAGNWAGAGDLQVDASGFLNYTPYTQTTIT